MYQPPPQNSVGASPSLAQPGALTDDPLSGPAARGTRVGRAREVGMVPERPARARVARAREPEWLLLSPAAARRPGAAAPRSRGRRACAPGARRTPPRRGRRAVVRRGTRPLRTVPESWAPSPERIPPRLPPGAAAAALPRLWLSGSSVSGDPRGVRREERRLRADARRERDVRVPPRRPFRVPPPLYPGSSPPSTGRSTARGRSSAIAQVVARRRDGAARARDRDAPGVGADRRAGGARRDAAPVPRLARRPRPTGSSSTACSPPRSSPARLAPPTSGARCRCTRARRGDRARHPLERPPAAPAARPRAIRRVARPAGPPDDRRGGVLVVVGAGAGPPRGGSSGQGGDRVRDDHDGHACALEGEQPGHVRRARVARSTGHGCR